MSDISPQPHPDPWVNRLHDYLAGAARALARQGCVIDNCWLDPSDPRDGTIVLNTVSGDKIGLVFNEEIGWWAGSFLSGRPGELTQLHNAAHLGGGVAPPVEELAWRYVVGRSAPAVVYRSYTDRDGLSDHLVIR